MLIECVQQKKRKKFDSFGEPPLHGYTRLSHMGCPTWRWLCAGQRKNDPQMHRVAPPPLPVPSLASRKDALPPPRGLMVVKGFLGNNGESIIDPGRFPFLLLCPVRLFCSVVIPCDPVATPQAQQMAPGVPRVQGGNAGGECAL
jgi:hypothetical protein